MGMIGDRGERKARRERRTSRGDKGKGYLRGWWWWFVKGRMISQEITALDSRLPAAAEGVARRTRRVETRCVGARRTARLGGERSRGATGGAPIARDVALARTLHFSLAHRTCSRCWGRRRPSSRSLTLCDHNVTVTHTE